MSARIKSNHPGDICQVPPRQYLAIKILCHTAKQGVTPYKSLAAANCLGGQARTLTTTDLDRFRLGLYVACVQFFDVEILYAGLL